MTEQLEHFPGLLIEAKTDPQGIVAGWASPFGGPADSYGDVIEPGAFAESIAAHGKAGTAPLMLWQHDQARPVGRWTKLEERSQGLWVEGRLNLQTTAGAETFAHLRAGDLSGLSIGYTVPEGGREHTRSGRRLTRINLAEISIVSMPAAPAARVLSVKSGPVVLGSLAELEKLLRDAGLSRGAAEKIARGGWPALTDEPDDDNNLKAIAAVLTRAAETWKV